MNVQMQRWDLQYKHTRIVKKVGQFNVLFHYSPICLCLSGCREIAMRLHKPIAAQLRQMNASKLTVGRWKNHENNIRLRWSSNRRQNSVGDKIKRLPRTKGISRRHDKRDKREKQWPNRRSDNCRVLTHFQTDIYGYLLIYTSTYIYIMYILE